jgi:hypothetical protein
VKDKSNHWLFVLAGAVMLAACSRIDFQDGADHHP